MNNKLIRLIALVLVSLMLLCAVACDGGSGGDETTQNPNGSTPAGPGGSTPAGPGGDETYEPIDVPEGLAYGNSVSILYWSDVEEPEFEVKDVSLDHTLNAIYWRNQNTVKYLGLDEKEGLVWTPLPGNDKQKASFAEQVGASYSSGKRDYDIVAAYSRTAALCAINGYYADLNAIDDSHLHLNRRWWTPSLVSTVTIDDSIYFLSGDISTNTIHMMYAIFCNTEMVKELNLEDPVKLAVNGGWTLDKFMSLCEGVFRELNNDSKPSAGDRFGFVSTQAHSEAFWQGSDLYYVEVDEDEVLLISDDVTSQKATTLVNKLIDFYQTIDVRGRGSPEQEFIAENALFTQNRMKFAQNYLSKVSFKYAVLPTPKYDDRQVGYRTCMANPFTLWAVMKDVAEDPDMLSECSAVLEVLAYQAYCNTTPQIFETNLKVKYTDENNLDTVKCFDLIRDGVVYDLGRMIPDTEIGTYLADRFSATVVGKDDWATVKAANLTMLRNNLEKIVEKIDGHKYG